MNTLKPKFLILHGVSNAGKTTLLKRLAGKVFGKRDFVKSDTEIHYIGRATSQFGNKLIYIGTDGDSEAIVWRNFLRGTGIHLRGRPPVRSEEPDIGITSTTSAEVIIFPVSDTASGNRFDSANKIRDYLIRDCLIRPTGKFTLGEEDIVIVRMVNDKPISDLSESEQKSVFRKNFKAVLAELKKLC